MDRSIRLRCDSERCRKWFWKVAREHRRCLKRGQTHFYCSKSCSIGVSNRTAPRIRVASHLNPANRLDELSPFRWFMLRVRGREKKKGKTDLTLDYLKSVWDRQNGLCPMTGWRMRLPDTTDGWRGGSVPESASLDRINNKMGYVRGNVRFVAVMVNMARQAFTDEDVQHFARSVARIWP